MVQSASVSVIMPTYNVEHFVVEAINSVLAQTRADLELLVVDDGSTDQTVSLIRELQGLDSRIKLIVGPRNQGAARARNAAIEVAQGRFIAFLDSDDVWKPEKLARQIAFMTEHDVALSFSSYDRIDEEGNLINIHHVKGPVTYHGLLKSCVIGCLTAVYDTTKVGKIFMPDVRKRQDFGLWLRILKIVDRAVPLPDSLAQYRVRTGSVSSNKFQAAMHTWTVYRDLENLSLVVSIYYFCHYALNGLVNTYVKPLFK